MGAEQVHFQTLAITGYAKIFVKHVSYFLQLCLVRHDTVQEKLTGSHNLRLAQPVGDGRPVDNVPDGSEVLGLAVLVLQVVGMLPSVNAQQGGIVADNGILVRACNHLEGAGRLILDKPGPAAALNTGQSCVHLLLKIREGAKILVNGGLGRVGCVSTSCFPLD